MDFHSRENGGNNQNQTLKETAILALDQQSLCIKCNECGKNFELKFNMIHLLPTFHGLEGKDPNKHLKEFCMVYFTMKPNGTSGE